jgi:hypothetical protein
VKLASHYESTRSLKNMRLQIKKIRLQLFWKVFFIVLGLTSHTSQAGRQTTIDEQQLLFLFAPQHKKQQYQWRNKSIAKRAYAGRCKIVHDSYFYFFIFIRSTSKFSIVIFKICRFCPILYFHFFNLFTKYI